MKVDIKNWKKPTPGQAEAGNYFKPRLSIFGFSVAVENPKGTVRTGKNEDGSSWSVKMTNHYGYIVGSKGADGDPVDVYVGEDQNAGMVFVIHQARYGEWAKYDEDKCMLGFSSERDAVAAYHRHYDDKRFLQSVTPLSLKKFKDKIITREGRMIKGLDLSLLPPDCENDCLEFIGKALSEDMHDIWAVHENPYITRIIELFTDRGLLRIQTVKEELVAWLDNARYTGVTAGDLLPGMMPVWSKDELSLVKLYLESVPQNAWQLSDYDYLVQYLYQRYMNPQELMTEAEWLTVKSHLMGKAQVYLNAMADPAIARVLSALPSTVAHAVHDFNLGAAERSVMEYARIKACDLVVATTDASRHALKMTVVSHMQKQLAGEASTDKLQQALFDRFDIMNRDWRRIAVTEAGEATNQGLVSALPAHSKVKRLEQYKGACGFCRKINGRIFNVVAADDPHKNGDTDVWPGKTNVGRSSSPRKRLPDGSLELRDPHEMWWVAAGVQHPNCRGGWTVMAMQKTPEAIEFAEWFAQRTGQTSGLSLAEWSPQNLS